MPAQRPPAGLAAVPPLVKTLGFAGERCRRCHASRGGAAAVAADALHRKLLAAALAALCAGVRCLDPPARPPPTPPPPPPPPPQAPCHSGRLHRRWRRSALPYCERLADFHLLLWLAGQPGLELAGASAAAVPGRCCRSRPRLRLQPQQRLAGSSGLGGHGACGLACDVRLALSPANADVRQIAAAVRDKAPLPEGYKIIVDSLAGM